MFVRPETKNGDEDANGNNNDNDEDDLQHSHHPNAAQFVAKNLVTLVNESKAGELASLEEVVASLVKDTLDKDKPTVLDPEASSINLPITDAFFLSA